MPGICLGAPSGRCPVVYEVIMSPLSRQVQGSNPLGTSPEVA